MKKIILIFAAVAAVACVSCSKNGESSTAAGPSTGAVQNQTPNDSLAVDTAQLQKMAEEGTAHTDSPEPTGDPAKDATAYVNYISKFFKSATSEEDLQAKQSQILAFGNKFNQYYKSNGKEKEFNNEIAKHAQEVQDVILETGKRFAKQKGMTDEQIAAGEQMVRQGSDAVRSAQK